MLNRRSLLIANSQQGGELPSGYTRLNYIESTGTEIINTNFTPSNKTRLVVDANIKSVDGLTNCIGCRAYYSGLSYWFGKGNTSINNLYAGYKNNTNVGGTNYFNNRHIFDFNQRFLYVDDSYIFSFVETVFAVPYPIMLFAVNDDYGNQGNPQPRLSGSIKLHHCQIYDDNLIVRDFIPCLDYNDIPCLFDTVNRQTYYNAGSGTFLYG